MAVGTLLDAVTATGPGSAFKLFAGENAQARNYRRGGAAIVQAVLTGTATVAVEGSLDGTNWMPITSMTASGGVEITPTPYLRGNVTARTDGEITLLLDHGERR